jgi:hypothetical protein
MGDIEHVYDCAQYLSDTGNSSRWNFSDKIFYAAPHIYWYFLYLLVFLFLAAGKDPDIAVDHHIYNTKICTIYTTKFYGVAVVIQHVCFRLTVAKRAHPQSG